jgi:hypothetical protein
VRSSLVRLIRGILAGLLVSGGLAYGQTPPDLGRHLGDIEGTFVLLNAATGEYVRYNPARAAVRFPPCSTFKVPNTAILLESGTAPDPASTLKYDPALKQPENWARDFDLRGAFKASALWYYQAMSRRAGMAAQRHFVEAFQYGNRDTSGGPSIAPALPSGLMARCASPQTSRWSSCAASMRGGSAFPTAPPG